MPVEISKNTLKYRLMYWNYEKLKNLWPIHKLDITLYDFSQFYI